MLALIYLFVMILLGDTICRRFYNFVSVPHRLAAAFLTGILISSWWTYLCALLFAGTSSPMLWGNIIFFISAAGLIYWLRTRPDNDVMNAGIDRSATEFSKWDFIILGVLSLLVCFLMFSTLGMKDGDIMIGTHQSSDYGSTLSIMQSFARGNNFPTEFPHFPGDRMRYHFLFYFQAGNLEYLGLSPAMSNNLLSVLSLVSMLVMVMTLGALLFGSRVVGRIAAALFFFHGTLSFYPFITGIGSVSGVISKILESPDFIASGFEYRGETWGVWSQVVYANQRHLASAIGIFLLVLVFLIMRYRAAEAARLAAIENAAEPVILEPVLFEEAHPLSDEVSLEIDGEMATGAAETTNDLDREEFVAEEKIPAPIAVKPVPVAPKKSPVEWISEGLIGIVPFIFSGVLLGLMPMWNGAVFTAAFAMLGLMFFLYPQRRQLVGLAIATAIFALPQVLYLKGGAADQGVSLLSWGYTLNHNATIMQVLEYIGFTFGFKLLLVAFALVIGTWFQRKLMVAMFSLLILTFCFQFSIEALTNHKFLNLWVVLANLFVAYGLWFLWNLKILKTAIFSRIAVVILTILITLSGLIDLFPFYTTGWGAMAYGNDRLVKWVTEETDPRAIFLTARYTNHGILIAGRKIFQGHPYYAWGAGYDTYKRDQIYKRLYESTNPAEVFDLLKENNISYVAFDNSIRRSSDLIKKPNEPIYEAYFDLVFDDVDNRYGNLAIYKVPEQLGAPKPEVQLPPEEARPELDPNAAVSAFTGGEGAGPGRFSRPRGIAVDAKGNIYVADSGNARIQKFDSDGKFLTAFGTPGIKEGQLKEPNGIAIDADGAIFVTDAANMKLMKFDADGKFVKEWNGPDSGFYGPRDVAIGPNKQVYVVDQGRTRIARFDPVTEAFSSIWGTAGTSDGQFRDPSGITIAGDMVYVTDTGNGRIQVFDLDGHFLRQWEIPDWGKSVDNPDAVFDEQTKRLYVTNGKTNVVLAFDVEGNPQQGFTSQDDAKLEAPSAIVIQDVNKKRRLLVLNTAGGRVSKYELEAKAEVTPKKGK